MSNLRNQIFKLKGEIFLHRSLYPDDIKPNFSALARETGLHRHTVARIYKSMVRGDQPKKRTRRSKFDPYDEEIKDRIDSTTSNLKSIFKFMQRKYGDEVFSSYDSFKSHVRARGLTENRKQAEKAHPRFETPPGKQVQFDWKENLKMTLKNGEVIDYNLFTAVFGASRQTVFIYSKTKTKEDLLRCLIQFINEVGGLPEEFITDNMSAIVSVNGNMKVKHPEILQLEKDLDTPIRLLPVRSPEKKGKVESANRFQNWMEPYQGQLESEEELIELVKMITRDINQEVNATTRMPRYVLFKKEKEHLRPLPSPVLLEHYLKEVGTQKVPATLLVQYKGNGYSVPKKFLGKRVKLISIGEELYIYYNGDLIATHAITNCPINYHASTYQEAMRDHYGSGQLDQELEETIKKRSLENLQLLKKLGEQKEEN